MLYADYKHAGFMSQIVSEGRISHYQIYQTIYRRNILPLILIYLITLVISSKRPEINTTVFIQYLKIIYSIFSEETISMLVVLFHAT